MTWEVLLGRAAPDVPGHVQVQGPRRSPHAVHLVPGGWGGSSEPCSSVLDIISNFKCLRFGPPQEAQAGCQQRGLPPRGPGQLDSFVQTPFSARGSPDLKQRNFHLSPLRDFMEGKWTPFGPGGMAPHSEKSGFCLCHYTNLLC